VVPLRATATTIPRQEYCKHALQKERRRKLTTGSIEGKEN